MPSRWHALEQHGFSKSDGEAEPNRADGWRCRSAEISKAGANSAGDQNAPPIELAIRSIRGADCRSELIYPFVTRSGNHHYLRI